MSRKMVSVLIIIFVLQITSIVALFIQPTIPFLITSLVLFAFQLALLIEVIKRKKQDNINSLNEYLSSFKNISSQIAHDFSNPMHVIQFCGTTLSKHVDEKGKKYLDRIMSCTDRSVALIDDLKELARVKQDKHKTFYDVHRFVVALVRLQHWKNMKPSSIFLDERARVLPIHVPEQDLIRILYTIYKTFIGNNWAPIVEIGVDKVTPMGFTLIVTSSVEFVFERNDEALLNKLLTKSGATLERENKTTLAVNFKGQFESILVYIILITVLALMKRLDFNEVFL